MYLSTWGKKLKIRTQTIFHLHLPICFFIYSAWFVVTLDLFQYLFSHELTITVEVMRSLRITEPNRSGEPNLSGGSVGPNRIRPNRIRPDLINSNFFTFIGLVFINWTFLKHAIRCGLVRSCSIRQSLVIRFSSPTRSNRTDSKKRFGSVIRNELLLLYFVVCCSGWNQ
jgi:hypothetical protein